MLQRFLFSSLLLVATTVGATDHYSQGTRVYRVTITNLTQGQVFSPPVIATHRSSVALFQLGAPASDELAALAENGKGGPLATLLSSLPEVFEAKATATPIPPGVTEVFEIRSRSYFDRISVAGMLVNTNDAFFAVRSGHLPSSRRQGRSFTAVGYDAGSEFNGEDCNYIPGPACGTMSEERDPGDPEGYVYVSNGIHGTTGQLDPSAYDWHNPVARIRVERIR